MLNFPAGFYWGSATSAHQVEGNNQNDWTDFEKQSAKRQVQLARSKNWPDYILNPRVRGPNPLQEENYISGHACDHYNRLEEDFDIAKSLGHNAHRFSIEWSRIEPKEGKFDEKEIEHYRKVVKALRERGIEPFITLWHWTNPIWFKDQGGWLNKKSIEWFSRYASRMAKSFPDVKFWITLNETNVYAGNGCWKGIRPPGKRSLFKYLKANHHFSRAHIAAYKIIKSFKLNAQVGIAHNVIYFTKFPAGIKNCFWNHLFFNSIRGHQDFIGLNYYHSDRPTKEQSEFQNWPIDPEGLYFVLKDAARHRKPIYILENGIADSKDEKRAEFIKDHLRAVAKAIQEGIDVRGYFYWSLLDNFEWDKGFWPRFGLVEVDYETLNRKIRPSAYEYKKIIEANSIEE